MLLGHPKTQYLATRNNSSSRHKLNTIRAQQPTPRVCTHGKALSSFLNEKEGRGYAMHSHATWKPWTLARGVTRIAKAASSTNEQESLTSTRARQSRGSIRGVARTKAATVQTTSNRERTSASKSRAADLIAYARIWFGGAKDPTRPSEHERYG